MGDRVQDMGADRKNVDGIDYFLEIQDRDGSFSGETVGLWKQETPGTPYHQATPAEIEAYLAEFGD